MAHTLAASCAVRSCPLSVPTCLNLKLPNPDPTPRRCCLAAAPGPRGGALPGHGAGGHQDQALCGRRDVRANPGGCAPARGWCTHSGAALFNFSSLHGVHNASPSLPWLLALQPFSPCLLSKAATCLEVALLPACLHMYTATHPSLLWHPGCTMCHPEHPCCTHRSPSAVATSSSSSPPARL